MQSSDYILKTSREYSIYVCQNRAIPHIADGLKNVQRLSLWLLRHRAEKMKTMALSGQLAMERLYTHGDVSANNAIGLLAAPYKNNVPLIEGLGHFGSKNHPEEIGAARYTEVRRTKIAETILYRDLELVPMEDNYDGSNQQPVHFLPLIPLVLLNGVDGIAVGWSTDILRHSLKSLIEATKLALLEKPLKPLVPYYEKYDLVVENIGTNRWELSGRAKVIDAGNIQITELPPGLDIETFRKRLIEMEDDGRIVNFTDRSSDNIDITVKMKRRIAQLEDDDSTTGNNILEWSNKQIIDFFKLRERVTERIVVIDWDGKGVRTYASPEEVVIDFAKWRLTWYQKRYELMTRKDSYELTYWNALNTLFTKNFPKKLGTFKDKAVLVEEVVSLLDVKLDDHQLDRVINLQTYKWTKSFEEEVDNHLSRLKANLAEYAAILASKERLRDVYIKELNEL